MTTYDRLRGLSVYPLRKIDPGRNTEVQNWDPCSLPALSPSLAAGDTRGLASPLPPIPKSRATLSFLLGTALRTACRTSSRACRRVGGGRRRVPPRPPCP